MSDVHTPKTLVAISPFLVRYLGLSTARTLTLIYVPSNAPKQPYNQRSLTNQINLLCILKLLKNKYVEIIYLYLKPFPPLIRAIFWDWFRLPKQNVM